MNKMPYEKNAEGKIVKSHSSVFKCLTCKKPKPISCLAFALIGD